MYSFPKICLLAAVCFLSLPHAADAKSGVHALILLNTGETREGDIENRTVSFLVENTAREIRLTDVLSIHTGAEATPNEKQRIEAGLAALAGTDQDKAQAGAEQLTEIGLPALGAMLAAQDPTDTDLHEPHLLYSVFARIMPAGGDRLDRTLDMVRLAGGTLLRGKLTAGSLTLTANGKKSNVSLTEIRRIAIRRAVVTRTLAVHSLRHCTQIEWLDTGVILPVGAKMESHSEGIVRLSFNLDKWTATPDGLIRPDATGQKRVIDGFAFGALLARAGAGGERKLLGTHFPLSESGTGRLYLAINDNGHWQNNIGAYRVKLRLTDVYDVGEPGE